jgi:hypothetical protein
MEKFVEYNIPKYNNRNRQKMKTKYDIIHVFNKIKELKEGKESNNTSNNTTKHTFFKRTENLTDVVFTENELQLLDKGLKYNLHHKPKTWIKTLTMEAHTVMRELPEKDQGYMKQLVANNIGKLIKKQYRNNESRKRNSKHTEREYQEWSTLKSIKQKLISNQLILTEANKGNTLIILKEEECNNKIENFINNNYFTKLARDITNKQQYNLRNSINKCKNLVSTNNKWKYINMNPSAPCIHGTIKLHKQEKSIRPIVNWKDSPGYKLAKYLYKILNATLQLPNAFNLQNSSKLAHSLKQVKIGKNTRLYSFDIENMYTNIPIHEVKT